MVKLSQQIIRTGSNEPEAERRFLRAGPLHMVLENGALRAIKLGEKEVLRGIYVAVRDRNWGTIAPHFLTYQIEEQEKAFQVHLSVEHTSGEVDFAWQGTISGDSDGTVRFTFDGAARRTFLKNRIGFCVLHSMDLAGESVTVETPQETVVSVFPSLISPHQPFVDIVAMSYPVTPTVSAEIRFSGDLFEMEDQRNWTDASYKTYCTPLRLPYPAELRAGESIQQSITLRLLGEIASADFNPPNARPVQVNVKDNAIGALPSIGLSMASPPEPLSERELARLRALRLAHLWVELDTRDSGWRGILQEAVNEAGALGSELELSVICDENDAGLEALIVEIATQHLPVTRLLLFDRATFVTTSGLISKAAHLLQEHDMHVLLGGGSRANFAEFNRAQLPFDAMALAGYPINPQVHTFDNISLVETLSAQAETVESAQAKAGSLPLSIGPVTLRPRFNAAATSEEGEQEPGTLPATVDVRQMSLFAASWTIGSIRHLAQAGARWLTYYETVGWRGVLERANGSPPGTPFPVLPAALFPLYHLFAEIAEFPHAQLLNVEVSDTSVIEALALRSEGRLLLLLAHLSAEERSIHVSLPSIQNARICSLDETNAEQALFDGDAYRQERYRPLEGRPEQLELHLLPYAFLRLDGTLASETG